MAQSWTVSGTPADAERWALRAYEALQVHGSFARPDVEGPAVPTRPATAHLLDLRVAWRWQRTRRGSSEGYQRVDRSILVSVERHVRELHGLQDDTPIPASVRTWSAARASCGGSPRRD